MKPKHELAQVVHRYGKGFLKQHPLPWQVLKTLQAIRNCRTAVLGGHKCKCNACGSEKYFYNSCRNRHCPRCQATNRERWIIQRETELLPVAYFHVVFTLPHELNGIALKHAKEVYNALFTGAWRTIALLAENPKHLGAKTGMTAVLHTWGQNLSLHPHVHCIVPAGGLNKQGKWKNTKSNGKYLFPQKVMASIFRAKFMASLRKQKVAIPQDIAKKLFAKQWVVYAKKPFAKPKHVIEYLGRYTHKIAISNHRLVSIKKHQIQFTYKNYKHGGKTQVATLDAYEFLRRFCQHILPKRFIRMRHYGILASKNKAIMLNTAKTYFNQKPWTKTNISWQEIVTLKGLHPKKCSACKKGEMVAIQVILPTRGPPLFSLPQNKIYDQNR